jgi:hypothetical protein
VLSLKCLVDQRSTLNASHSTLLLPPPTFSLQPLVPPYCPVLFLGSTILIPSGTMAGFSSAIHVRPIMRIDAPRAHGVLLVDVAMTFTLDTHS